MVWVTQKDFAELLGISRAAVCKAVKRGRLEGATRLNAAGKIEIDQAEGVRLWQVNSGRPDLVPHPVRVQAGPAAGFTPARRSRVAEGGDDEGEGEIDEEELPEIAISRRRNEHFKSLQQELEYRILDGQHVAVDEVAKAVEKEYAAIRARLLALKVIMAPELQGLDDLVQIEAIIDRHVLEALQELSDPYAAGAFGTGPRGTEAAA
ncbi:hypothetical protein [Pseudomonas schmalbachii]|uniref:Helix-turn-helix domain-containing protein n=1 Tax=Pseudomonas schmalbachii TaxID=2816993 RepID=A0ABS3TLZ0_9PSED|nr:hypothetical protein [Pseudomonas schmalbachii]MBO3274138.1 hypothetical protein [Pseudomonas schmalbachii]